MYLLILVKLFHGVRYNTDDTLMNFAADAFKIRIVWNQDTQLLTGVLTVAGGLMGGYAGGRLAAAVGAGIGGVAGLGIGSESIEMFIYYIYYNVRPPRFHIC